MSDWNDVTVGWLRQLWNEGHSTAEIGRRMGISKNAVIGKAGRVGLVSRASPIRSRDSNALPPRRVVHVKGPTLPSLARDDPPPPRIIPMVRLAPKPPAQLVAPIPAPLPSGPCQFPMWGNGRPTHVYCGARSEVGKPYCEEHWKRTHTRGWRDMEDAA